MSEKYRAMMPLAMFAAAVAIMIAIKVIFF